MKMNLLELEGQISWVYVGTLKQEHMNKHRSRKHRVWLLNKSSKLESQRKEKKITHI
jgi:hypothetical protein